MDVRLAIRRFEPESRRSELREYAVAAPEWASLLDVLELVKEQVDGSLAFRRSCRMMICGSCGMRMDGRTVLACRERLQPLVEAGSVPVIEPLGNLPVIKDLVVDMTTFWQRHRSQRPWVEPGCAQPEDGRENIVSQAEADVIQKEGLCVNCACCVSECESWRQSPSFLGPHALTMAMRFAGDVRDGQSVDRLETVSGRDGIWGCTRCQACGERCPKGVDPLDAITKLAAESIARGLARDPGARQASWHLRSVRATGLVRETELFARTHGAARSLRELPFLLALLRRRKARVPLAPAAVEHARQLRALHDIVADQDRRGALGVVQGERALARIGFGPGDGTAAVAGDGEQA